MVLKIAVYAEVVFERGEDGILEAKEYLHAPGRGDEIIKLVQMAIQKESNRRGEQIRHAGRPTNPAAKILFRRTEGYKAGHDKNGSPIYLKTFYPQPQKEG